MVQAPSFFTRAGQDVRSERSRSVAVMVRRSPTASKRKFDRIGMVVLRSTTPEVAVSSLSRSNLLTVISIADPDVRDSVVSDCVSTPRPGIRRGSSTGVGLFIHRLLLLPYTENICKYRSSNRFLRKSGHLQPNPPPRPFHTVRDLENVDHSPRRMCPSGTWNKA